MNKLVRTMLSAAMLALAAAAQAEEPVILKFSHFWPPQAMAPTRLMEPWCAKIAQDSNNRMKCQMYPAMQLGGTPAQLYQQAVDGVADIVWTLPGYTAGRFPSVEAFELPFMTNSAETASRALWDYAAKYGQKDFAQVKPLAFHVHDEGYVHDNVRPIKTLEDFKGLRMRAPTRMTNKLLAALGASPVSMPLPAVAEGLSKGVMDGYILPWEVIPAVKLHELTKYHTETDPGQPALYTAVFVVAMNKAKYDSLPPDLKKVIDSNSGAEWSTHIGKVWDESAIAGRKKAVEHGNQFSMVPAAELANWRKVGDKVTADWVAEMSGKGLPAQEMLDSARSLIAKYKK